VARRILILLLLEIRVSAILLSDAQRHRASTRWHLCEAQAAREKAQEITFLIQQALKDDRQLPLI
jgi:hypothetical protein